MFSISYIKTTGILFAVMFLMTACSSRQKDLQSRQAELYFGAGTQSLMQKQYTEALKNLMKANELDPNNSEILNNLGMAYYFKSETELAIRTLNRSLEINPKNSDAKVNLASIYFHDGKMREAEKLYKEVTEDLTYDKQARTYYNLGVLELMSKKNHVAAENYFKKSVKEDENYCPSYYQLGLIQYKRGQFNSALNNFKDAAMGTCYESPAPHYYQALSLIELKKYEEARIKLDEIDTRFKQNEFAVKARQKVIELNELENRRPSETHASRKMLETPDF
jgi:type IV pilus assembly protein PilF